MLQILGGTGDVARHRNHGHHSAFQVLVLVQTAQGLYEEVNAFVLKLITTAVNHQEAIGGECLAAQRTSNLQDLRPDSLAFLFEGGLVFPKGMVDAVLGHHIGLAIEELLALLSRDITHRREGIGILGGLLLHRLLRDDVELHGHHRRQVRLQVVIEGEPIT